MDENQPSRGFLFTVFLISGTSLAYEVLSIRLLSIVSWHHLAYMVMSLALLGYGVSGTFILLASRLIERAPELAYVINAVLFGISSVGCFLAAQTMLVNPAQMLWEGQQVVRLAAMYLLLSLPFFFASNCIAIAIVRHKRHLHRVYAVDLFGAGVGALGVVLVLHALSPGATLKLLGCVALIAAALAWSVLGCRPRKVSAYLALCALLAPFALSQPWAELRPLQYKGLQQALKVVGTRIVTERSGPLGLLQVLESPKVPFRIAPGLSLNTPALPPAQLALFTDADGMTAITRFDGDLRPLAFLAYMPSAAPYRLRKNPRVLILGAGGGLEVLQALYHRARRIDAVEQNPQVIGLVRDHYRDYTGALYTRDPVHIHLAEARGYIATAPESFDIIQIALLEAFNTSASGLYALNESYLYTVEAFQQAIKKLAPGGLLAVTRWVKVPPRDELKLFATAIAALRTEGVEDPGRQLAWLRGWRTSTLLVKNGKLRQAELRELREFCRARSFDLAYLPGMKAHESNRYNLLPEPYFFTGAEALLGDAAGAFLDRYKFDIKPATDDRPYFFQWFKWPVLKEAFASRGAGGYALLDLGYLVLLATLIQALALSVLLISLPLRFINRRGPSGPKALKVKLACYFLAVGLGFMLIEVGFFQRFVLYLSHPLYAMSVVLTGFLIFGGAGSMTLARQATPQAAVTRAVTAIVVITLIYQATLPMLFAATLAWNDAVKIAITLLVIAPLAYFMGRPYPAALRTMSERAPLLIPWAWGINGCASVLGAVLAMVISIELGLSAVVYLAAILYLLAATLRP
ncbi:MAG: SAM-dependent methyltransferase [Gammaproteobacteria bacterium]